ncbi:MAG TPA: acyl-CoA dehydrogenase family protein [Acidimicrobiia bacterium]|nr:acyl-CoA dehydrogenase family protein [Acidimicrobiia bacterium]
MSSPHAIFSAEHAELRTVVRRFVDTEVRPNVDAWEHAGRFPDSLFRRCGELGFLGLHYPARFGGGDGDLAAGLVFVEELARCGAGAIPMAISVQTDMATPALAHFGTDDQRDRWLVPAITGAKIGAIAITEPDAGSDVAAIDTRAVRDGDVWRVNGRKMFITNGTRAHFLTLVVKTDPGAGHHGMSLFIVDTSLPGVSVSRTLEKLGMRSSDTAEIALDDVPVPHRDLIGLEPGQGFAQLMWQLQYERLAGAAASVGHATQVLAETIAYARQRHTFGRPISHHQVIAHNLADAATELEAAKSLLYSTAWRVMHDEYPVTEISMTKKFCAQVQNRLVDACVQVFGGAGYLEETPVARAFRDARLQRIGGGTDEIMNEVIAKRLGLGRGSA